MKVQVNREKVLFILNWCINKFGLSKFKKSYPKLRVYKSCGKSEYNERELGLYGTCSNGLITIFLGTNHSMNRLCKTVLHEYKHYLMCDDEYIVLEKKLKKCGIATDKIYDKHPHEIRARKFEKTWGDICFKELKNKLYAK